MNIDDATIRDLLALEDEQGVLSFYTGHTPEQAADPQPTAPIELRNQLKQLRARLERGDRDTARAVEQRLSKLDGPLSSLLDPKAPGRGRAMFVGVASGEERTLALQLPFRQRVVHDATAYVRPLVAALDEGRPALIVVVSRTGVRVLHWATGDAEVTEEARFEKDQALFRDDSTGPSTSNPQRAMFARSDRDGFEDRVDEHRHRFLKQVIDDVVQRAEADGVDRLVLSAPPKLRDEVRTLVGDHDTLRVLVADQAWESTPSKEVAAQAWELLRSVHGDREEALVTSAKERAFAGGQGALGLRNVCAALNAGRVEHLMYDDGLTLEGFVSSQGTLHPRIEGAVAESDLTFSRHPLFVERLIEAALATSASVTPLNEPAAAELADHEGVAALLRW
ncbi:MAG: hypothetical protein EA387_08120 [Nitriliruptor sp.]|nr:MAG: hypothetical protein EA387_08120 [Nitriliruptor sp.]